MSNRIIFSVHTIGFAPEGSLSFIAMKGIQSVGLTTTFNLEQVFELGQISIFENIENIPDIEVTAEKVLTTVAGSTTGTAPMFCYATQGAASASLSARAARKCNFALSVYEDVQDSASGTPRAQCYTSGLVVSNSSFNFSADGNFIESISLIGNNKLWLTSGFSFTPSFLNTDTAGGSGGVNRREDMLFAQTVSTLDANNHIADPNCTILPGGTGGVAGISASGINVLTNDTYSAHITSISVNAALNRDQITELGRKAPYFRFLTFPVPITCDISIVALTGDLISGTEAGVAGNGNNLTNKSIRIATREGTRINLGTSNKLQSVSYNGGDTGGGNVTCTYSYSTFNDFSVTHPDDPTTALAIARFNPS